MGPWKQIQERYHHCELVCFLWTFFEVLERRRSWGWAEGLDGEAWCETAVALVLVSAGEDEDEDVLERHEVQDEELRESSLCRPLLRQPTTFSSSPLPCPSPFPCLVPCLVRAPCLCPSPSP